MSGKYFLVKHFRTVSVNPEPDDLATFEKQYITAKQEWYQHDLISQSFSFS